MLGKLQTFCQKYCAPYPPTSTAILAEFFCELAQSSDRPRAVLTSASAAVGNMYFGMNLIDNLVEDQDIRQLLVALIKTATTAPREPSKVMPVDVFSELFMSWEENEKLSFS